MTAPADKATILIEKLGLAVHGEDPAMVIVVLAAFVREYLDRYEISANEFIAAVMTMDALPGKN